MSLNAEHRDAAIREVVGHVIRGISVMTFDDNLGTRWDRLEIITESGTLALHDEYDGGGYCDETRWMVCDDDLEYIHGATLCGIELLDAPSVPNDEGDTHEVQFLRVFTSMGNVTVETHNEHNGYYGGFDIVADYEPHQEDVHATA